MSFLIADHHNKLDTTELDLLFLGMFFVCAFVLYYIKKLMKKEEQDF